MAEELLIRSTVAPHVQAANLVGIGGISVVFSPGQITLSGGGGGGFVWVNVTDANNPITFSPDAGYVASGAVPVSFMLPASAAFGDAYRIAGNGNLWTVGQNAGQVLTLGNKNSTAGVFGGISATLVSDCVEIVCIVANTTFQIISSIGNITIF